MIPMLAMFHMTFDQAHAVWLPLLFELEHQGTKEFIWQHNLRRRVTVQSCGAFWVRITWLPSHFCLTKCRENHYSQATIIYNPRHLHTLTGFTSICAYSSCPIHVWKNQRVPMLKAHKPTSNRLGHNDLRLWAVLATMVLVLVAMRRRSVEWLNGLHGLSLAAPAPNVSNIGMPGLNRLCIIHVGSVKWMPASQHFAHDSTNAEHILSVCQWPRWHFEVFTFGTRAELFEAQNARHEGRNPLQWMFPQIVRLMKSRTENIIGVNPPKCFTPLLLIFSPSISFLIVNSGIDHLWSHIKCRPCALHHLLSHLTGSTAASGFFELLWCVTSIRIALSTIISLW